MCAHAALGKYNIFGFLMNIIFLDFDQKGIRVWHPPIGFFVMLREQILSCWPFEVKMSGNVISLYLVPNLATNRKNTFVQQSVI
jgi:hypothetical protein